MKRHDKLTISRIVQWSWNRRFVTFFAVFTTEWAMLEPLFAVFGEPSPLVFLGVWRYFCFVSIAILITLSVEYSARRKFKGKLSFINFDVVIMENGARYRVEAPEDMRSEDFVSIFMREVSKDASPQSLLSRSDMYINSLMVDKGGGCYIEAWSLKSLRENNIRSRSVCKIYGRIHHDRMNVCYGPTIMVRNDTIHRTYRKLINLLSNKFIRK